MRVYEERKMSTSTWIFNGSIFINLSYIKHVEVEKAYKEDGYDLLGWYEVDVGHDDKFILNEEPFETKEEAIQYFNEIITQSR